MLGVCGIAGWPHGSDLGGRAWLQGHCGAAAGPGRRPGGQDRGESGEAAAFGRGPRAGVTGGPRTVLAMGAMSWGVGWLERGKLQVAMVACFEGRGRRRHVASQGGSTALVMASWSGHKDTVELLLDRGADLRVRTWVSRARPLPTGWTARGRHGREEDRVGDGGGFMECWGTTRWHARGGAGVMP